MNRIHFLQQLSLASAGCMLPSVLQARGRYEKLTILHTNDMHSRIDPFPMDGGKWQGLGGLSARARLIEEIRRREEHVLLLDSGDILQGTPYFNFFQGEPEFRGMSAMGYDAATLGNHDFDAGLDGLKKLLPLATFTIINANYDFSDTILADSFAPYRIIQKGNLKIGILGIGIELTGLVPEKLYGNTRYRDAIDVANQVALQLKQRDQCDLVICLSHLGHSYSSGKIGDTNLAAGSAGIDIILGGHTHTLLEEPVIMRNRENQPVVIQQSGWGGAYMGKLDVYVSRGEKKKNILANPIKVSN